MTAHSYGYGLWQAAALSSFVFIAFAFGFARPKAARDWRAFGAFSAFVVALFTEMYGFPLTLYFLSGWLQTRYPELDLFAHDAGHLWQTVLGLPGDPHLSSLHVISALVVLAALLVLGIAWLVLYRAQRAGRPATRGPYALVRHPQYAAFIAILLAFLLQWPTLLTLFMFPVLAVMYARLARREESDMEARFGDAYRRYAERTPRFVPRLLPRARAASSPVPANKRADEAGS
ncbi:MAG: isoprenylcysteine carboxylmethyltransferase family protein [Betaproteobacteria bacterium]|nr:isoprenylcysteine carboxylmethyltransferase family protein [Betaproteobacteria bacterium]